MQCQVYYYYILQLTYLNIIIIRKNKKKNKKKTRRKEEKSSRKIMLTYLSTQRRSTFQLQENKADILFDEMKNKQNPFTIVAAARKKKEKRKILTQKDLPTTILTLESTEPSGALQYIISVVSYSSQLFPTRGVARGGQISKPYSNQGGILCPSHYCQPPPRIQKAIHTSEATRDIS